MFLFGSDRFRQACSPVSIHVDRLNFADVFTLRHDDALIWLLGNVDSREGELACLLAAEWKLDLELGDLLIEIFITPTLTIVDMDS